MNALEKEILAQVENNHEEVVKLRRHLHANPELSAQEFKTQEYIEQYLDTLGLSHLRTAKTGVVTEVKGELEGEDVIILRADIDALPIQEEHASSYQSQCDGVMHACGHDAHTASLLGALKILSVNKHLFGGTVRAIFQPGEEIGYGAILIEKEGHLKGASRTFGIHLAPEVDCGKVVLMDQENNASVDAFTVKVHGKSAHVSTPEQGIDALYVASLMVSNLQGLITRTTNPMENVLIGIGKFEAGSAYNIVAQEARFEGTLRCLSVTLREEMISKMNMLCEALAKSYGANIEIEWKSYAPVLVNGEIATKEAQGLAKRILGETNVIERRKPALSGDDMAIFLNAAEGTYAYVGSGNDARPETRVSIHNSHFDIDEDCLKVGVLLYSLYAMEYLNGAFKL
ncbi:MAG: amidohydrolase [Solobacterium sp.]|nr:amidohydrolase [Solobacterium sp.]